MTVNMIICAVLTGLGLLFMIASLIGIATLPDFFTRLHAQGVGDTIGAFLILAGMMAAAWGGLLPVKIFLIFIVIVLTNPIGTNLMMIAAINKEDYLGYRTRMYGEKNEPDQVIQADAASGNTISDDDMSETAVSENAAVSDDSTISAEEKAEVKEKSSDKQKPKSRRRRKPKPSMKMNKEELIRAAEARGIKVPDKATKREILDLIYDKKNDQ